MKTKASGESRAISIAISMPSSIRHPSSVILFGLMIVCLFITAGCASRSEIQPTRSALDQSPQRRLITGIQVFDLPESCKIRIQGNQILTFTSVRQPSGAGVALYFPDTGLGDITNPLTPQSGVVQKISAFEMSPDVHTIRVDIALNQDIPYDIIREDLDLIIAFQKNSLPQPAMETSVIQSGVVEGEKPAQHLIQIDPIPMKQGTRVDVMADGPIRNYTSFTLEKPARIVFDMFGLNSSKNREETIPVQQPGVNTIRYYGDSNKIRLVIETDPAYLKSFSGSPVPNGLQIQVGQPDGALNNAIKTAVPVPVASTTAAEKTSTGKGPAWINQVDFLDEESGQSVVTIGTTHAVSYTVERPTDKRIRLNLANTKISEYRKYPLITSRFQSAVDRIVPSAPQSPKNTAYVDIDLREAVPYHVEQDDNQIHIRFDPSSLPPAPGIQTAAAGPVGTGPTGSTDRLSEQTLPVGTPQKVQMAVAGTVAAETKRSDVYSDAPKVYTGDKIAFDFFDTDIRNVFKIIGDISGENFAIDPWCLSNGRIATLRPISWQLILLRSFQRNLTAGCSDAMS